MIAEIYKALLVVFTRESFDLSNIPWITEIIKNGLLTIARCSRACNRLLLLINKLPGARYAFRLTIVLPGILNILSAFCPLIMT